MSATAHPPMVHDGSRTLEVRAPADGALLAAVPQDGPAAVAAAAGRLRAAQPAWEALGPRGRAAQLRRFRDWLLDHDDELAATTQRETGKCWQDAVIEVPVACDVLNFYAALAPAALAARRVRPHNPLTATKRLRVVHRPHPVVGVICPWNFPVGMALLDAVPALLAGAAVLLKPSERTPLGTLRIVEGWQEAGGPDVLACVTGAGATGAAVVDEVDFVQFTGSSRTGRRVAVRAAERLVPCSLELGGKDAMVVLADADLQRAANAAVYGATFNAGQACNAVERVYVEGPVHDAFVAAVAERAAALRPGADPQDFTCDLGTMASEEQAAIVDRHVADALAKGARAVVGGADGVGCTRRPTVLTEVDHRMAVMREETFGPVLPVMRVADAEEAVRLANDSAYGLSASVWSRDRRRGERVADRLEVGAVNVNDVFANFFCVRLPMGGWKASGLGARLGGADGLLKFCRTQARTTALVAPARELPWSPYDPVTGRRVRTVLRVLAARGRRRLRAARAMAAPRR